MRFFWCLFVAMAVSVRCMAAGYAGSAPLPEAVEAKNFYLLSALEKDHALHDALGRDPALAQISAERARFLAQAVSSCKDDVPCRVKMLLWTEEEIHSASLALAKLYSSNAELKRLVDGDLRASRAYELDERRSGDELLASAWELCAHGLNDILSVYGEGEPPRYPKIDSISFDVNSAEFRQQIASLVSKISADGSAGELFFEPSLKAALQLLAMNHRDEAGRHEPMGTTVNAAAVKAIPTTQWQKYAYSVIVVPGAGPEDADTALSDEGRKRTELAAKAYHDGQAPFILVSGGYVHPSQTRFAEALEMKKALLQDYRVPEAAILVDPHARHTTTNMRNAAREIYRYRMPMDKPALVVSGKPQVDYIAGQGFSDRCLKELGYLPYRVLSRPSATSLAFLPELDSLQQDPMDPLDP